MWFIPLVVIIGGALITMIFVDGNQAEYEKSKKAQELEIEERVNKRLKEIQEANNKDS